MTILVTGGTGYIGSHTVVELMGAGRAAFLTGNLCNSKAARAHRRAAAGALCRLGLVIDLN